MNARSTTEIYFFQRNNGNVKSTFILQKPSQKSKSRDQLSALERNQQYQQSTKYRKNSLTK